MFVISILCNCNGGGGGVILKTFSFGYKLELLKYTAEKNGTGGKDQPHEGGTDWTCFNLVLNILIKLDFLLIIIWIHLNLLYYNLIKV